MNYRPLGASGIRVSEIALGGWLTFGNAVEGDAGRDIIAAAFDLGINLIDTANVYAQGKCEEALGEWLLGRPRESYVLATKAFFPVGDGPNDRGLGRKHLFDQVHKSLRRLRTDHIDLYQCHRFDEETPLEVTIRAMDDLVRQGKILHWGVSEWSADQIDRCLAHCGERWERPVANQPQYNLLQRKIERSVMPLCARSGMGLVVWSPLAQGLLTGKYRPGHPPPTDSRAADTRQNHFIKAKAHDRELLEAVARLKPIAEELGYSVAQIALAWILTHQEVSSCIVGATKVSQLRENALASGIKLPAAMAERMEAALSGVAQVAP
ncbi:MAG: aldo/keto reductase family protein [Candidatus Sumerlaeia bacterium]|nr:aldo/keto reductase family protein [Candidatus Sumerlaeia bacterium]